MSDNRSSGPTPNMRKVSASSSYGCICRGGKTPTAEEKLRAENPGLQELWVKYQLMLKLVKPPDDPRLVHPADLLAQIRTRDTSPSALDMHTETDTVTPKEKGSMLDDIRNKFK